MSCNIFVWGFAKDQLFIPPLPHDFDDLKAWIIAAVKNTDAPMMTRVWQELEYHIDVCCDTRGAHIEQLYLSKKKKTFSVFLWL
jgi:hypothetical protein